MTRTIKRITGVKYTTALRWRLAHGEAIRKMAAGMERPEDAIEHVLTERGVWR